MDTIDTKSCSHISSKFICKICDYNINKKSSYDKHLLTAKHIVRYEKIRKATEMLTKVSHNAYKCSCDKAFKYHSGLWRHKKICAQKLQDDGDNFEKSPEPITSDISDKEIIKLLIHENSEFKSLILEILKKETSNITTNCNNTNNSHNKTFNLQIFLNEDCKNAMNISEFVSSIKMDLNDLEKTGRLGYVTGVSNIINKNLSDLDQTMRPIHCSDAKREVFYVKSEDQWIKETDAKPVLTKAIKQIAHENICQISAWQKKYPDCTASDSKKNDMYLNIVSNAMSGGSTEEQLNNYDKIITNVAKEVTIEK